MSTHSAAWRRYLSMHMRSYEGMIESDTEKLLVMPREADNIMQHPSDQPRWGLASLTNVEPIRHEMYVWHNS